MGSFFSFFFLFLPPRLISFLSVFLFLPPRLISFPSVLLFLPPRLIFFPSIPNWLAHLHLPRAASKPYATLTTVTRPELILATTATHIWPARRQRASCLHHGGAHLTCTAAVDLSHAGTPPRLPPYLLFFFVEPTCSPSVPVPPGRPLYMKFLGMRSP